MEDQNLNLPAAMSPSSTQNGSETTNNPVTMEVVGVDAGSGSDTGAKSGLGDSNFPPVKRGRGRPRKNDVGGSQHVPVSPTPELAIQSYGSEEKRGRGRPRGSGKFQILASIGGFVAETAGGSMTPHVLTVNSGEDVVSKIFTFFQNGPRVATCILSAVGIVSSVVLRQPNVSGGYLRYEGQFTILSLTGSCTFTSGAAAGAQRKMSLLSVSLAKPDGRIFGGAIENSMIAATPIPVILATFKQNISNQIKRKYSASTSAAPNTLPNEDSDRDNNSKVPKLTIEEGEPSCKTPNATENTNGVTVAAETGNVVSVTKNVTVLADENVHSDSATGGGVGIDLESMEPDTENKTSP